MCFGSKPQQPEYPSETPPYDPKDAWKHVNTSVKPLPDKKAPEHGAGATPQPKPSMQSTDTGLAAPRTMKPY